MPPATDTTERIETGLFIHGEEIRTEDRLTVFDPAIPTQVVGEAAAATTEHVQQAISSANKAYASWSGLSSQERAEVMGKAIDGVEADRDTDAEILSRENGKPTIEGWIDALVFEVRWKLAMALAEEVDQSTVLPTADGIPTETMVSYKSLGVSTIIIPFNWPLAILGASLPQALLAGNTVIVKPPPSAPLATTRVVQRVAEKLPAGVINIITGRDRDLSELIQSPQVAKLTFTGSVGGGKKMQELASHSLTRLTLELGGNDPAVVLDDAILDDKHLDRLFHAVYDTTGQICMNAKRLYVQRSRVDEVVDGLAKRLENTVLGHGIADGTTMGPLHSRAQKDFVTELIAEAKASGVKVLEFGELPQGDLAEGHFVRPAIVVDPDESLRVVTEEQFGPVIPVIPVDSEDEAVNKANDTWAGLCGSVWSGDIERAQQVASKIVAGYIWINDHGAARLDNRAPFGGFKQSGFGREMGIEGVRAFQATHSVAVLDESAVQEH